MNHEELKHPGLREDAAKCIKKMHPKAPIDDPAVREHMIDAFLLGIKWAACRMRDELQPVGILIID